MLELKYFHTERERILAGYKLRNMNADDLNKVDRIIALQKMDSLKIHAKKDEKTIKQTIANKSEDQNVSKNRTIHLKKETNNVINVKTIADRINVMIAKMISKTTVVIIVETIVKMIVKIIVVMIARTIVKTIDEMIARTIDAMIAKTIVVTMQNPKKKKSQKLLWSNLMVS